MKYIRTYEIMAEDGKFRTTANSWFSAWFLGIVVGLRTYLAGNPQRVTTIRRTYEVTPD